MKKIKFYLLAMAAMMLTAVTFTACSDDDDSGNAGNVDLYQDAVDNTVKAQKKHDKALLLVAFGSTWQEAFDSFDETLDVYKANFPDYDVFMSFSSAICINRAAAGEHVAPRYYYAPQYWLEAFGRVQYGEVRVQSLQVIPGEEYGRVINAMKDFANNSRGDLDDTYLSTMKLYLGTPLMAQYPEDVDNLANALDANFKAQAAQGVVAFMGHGNPDSYDTYKANVRYAQLETALQGLNKNYYVGTVDMPENYKVQVLERMQDGNFKNGMVTCVPLMSIAGDHAHNDMGGDDGEDMDNFEVNDEGEVEDMSWKVYFSKNGYDCTDETMVLKGLLRFANVRQLWIEHTKNAELCEDFYHSKNPE